MNHTDNPAADQVTPASLLRAELHRLAEAFAAADRAAWRARVFLDRGDERAEGERLEALGQFEAASRQLADLLLLLLRHALRHRAGALRGLLHDALLDEDFR
jgi:uncharacterized damage-inducible protein DinB